MHKHTQTHTLNTDGYNVIKQVYSKKCAMLNGNQCCSARCNLQNPPHWVHNVNVVQMSASSARLTASASLNKCATLRLTITSNKSASLHRKWRQLLYTRSITTPKFLTRKFSRQFITKRSQEWVMNFQAHYNDTSKLVMTMPMTKPELYIIQTRFKCKNWITSDDTDEREWRGEKFHVGSYWLLMYAVARLVEALRYKPEGRGFYSRRHYGNSSFT